jgi:hypothetical protein
VHSARVSGRSSIKSLVLRGSGVTLLSLLDVLDEVQRGQLAFIPLRAIADARARCTAPGSAAAAAYCAAG